MARCSKDTGLILSASSQLMRCYMSSLKPDHIIGAPKRREMVPYSDMHIWRLEKAGKFPKRIRLGVHRVGWSNREIQEWIAARKKERATSKN